MNSFKAKAEFIKLGNIDVEREFNDVRAVCKTYLGLLEKGKAQKSTIFAPAYLIR